MQRATNAGFRYTLSADSVEKTYLLQEGLRGLRRVHTDTVFTTESLDGTNREITTVRSGRCEVRAMIRYGDLPKDWLETLKHSPGGRSVIYIPDMNNPEDNYPCSLTFQHIAEILRVVSDDDWVKVRMVRTDGGNFEGLFESTHPERSDQ